MIFRTFQWFNLTYLLLSSFFSNNILKKCKRDCKNRCWWSREKIANRNEERREKRIILYVFSHLFFFSNKFYICSIDVKCKFNFSSLFWNRFKFITLLHYFIFYIWIYRNKCILLNYFYTFFKYISLFVFISIIFILFISL